jgi:DNA-binding GntR family transcriptional regulator
MNIAGPSHSSSISNLAFGRLADAITRDVLAPGAAVSEVSLAERLGISRGSLREVTRRLEKQALAEHRAILAAMRKRDADLAEQTMRQHVRCSSQNVKAEVARAVLRAVRREWKRGMVAGGAARWS